MERQLLLQLLLMMKKSKVRKIDRAYKWIHPNMILIDHELFTIYFKHIGFYDEDFIINYNQFHNKCDCDLRVKNRSITINDVGVVKLRSKMNNLKSPAKEIITLPYLIHISNDDRINFKVEIDVFKDKPRILEAQVMLEIDYYPSLRNYKILKSHIKE